MQSIAVNLFVLSKTKTRKLLARMSMVALCGFCATSVDTRSCLQLKCAIDHARADESRHMPTSAPVTNLVREPNYSSWSGVGRNTWFSKVWVWRLAVPNLPTRRVLYLQARGRTTKSSIEKAEKRQRLRSGGSWLQARPATSKGPIRSHHGRYSRRPRERLLH